MNDLASLPVTVELTTSSVVFSRVQSLGRKQGLTAYDTAYLDLALSGNLPLATLDDNLIRACKRTRVQLVQL